MRSSFLSITDLIKDPRAILEAANASEGQRLEAHDTKSRTYLKCVLVDRTIWTDIKLFFLAFTKIVAFSLSESGWEGVFETTHLDQFVILLLKVSNKASSIIIPLTYTKKIIFYVMTTHSCSVSCYTNRLGARTSTSCYWHKDHRAFSSEHRSPLV